MKQTLSKQKLAPGFDISEREMLSPGLVIMSTLHREVILQVVGRAPLRRPESWRDVEPSTMNGVTMRRIAASEATLSLIYVLHNELGAHRQRATAAASSSAAACMVLIDGEAAYSCSREIGSLAGKSIETIRVARQRSKNFTRCSRLSSTSRRSQCGYCLSGHHRRSQGVAG